MSDEEKKAIEIIKGLYIEEYDWYEDSKYCTGHSGKAVTIVEDSLEKILKLIDKQQKEIEEKNIAINKMSKDISRQLEETEKLNFENHMLKKWNEQLDKNYISKDKIRKYFMHEIAFKKRLQREKQKIDKYNRGRFDAIEEILELLEEK